MAKRKPKSLEKDTLRTSPATYYSSRTGDRQIYEDRAKNIALYTLPYLIREESDSGTSTLKDATSQSYGGRLVNTLKAKMGMALLPPATSSFRYVPNQIELQALTGGDKNNIAKIHQALSQNISIINAEIEVQQIRTALFDVIAQLLVVGSTIVEKVKDGNKGIKQHTLQSFVADLDSQGNPLKMCFVETLKVLPEGIVIKESADTYLLYTLIVKDDKGEGWTVTQEINGEMLPKVMTYKDYDDLPYRYLGWTWMNGDDYHRSYSEDYVKDLEQLNKLAKLLTDGAIISAKNIIFVNEQGGRTRKDEVANSVNGAVIDGVATDVTTFKNEKNFDFQVPSEREIGIKRELASAYLMNESVTRDAERVTAREISFMARELESSSLAGMYSKMALNWSKWLVHQIMLEKKIQFKSIEVEILTGLDALGRSQEAQKLDNYMQRLAALEMTDRVNKDELATRWAAFDGINTVGLLLTPDEYKSQQEAKAQAQQQQQLVEGASKGAAQGAAKSATENASQGEPQA